MTAIRAFQKQFSSYDGTLIRYRSWTVEQPRGHLVVIHGAGEHSGRYRRLAEFFTQQGLSVHAWDARGHGESPGQRGHVDEWRDFREDLHYFLKAVRRQSQGHPLLLLGHSMGGLMTMDYLLHYRHEDIAAYVCSSPAIGKLGVPPVLLQLAKVLSRAAPRLSMDTGLDINNISRDHHWLKTTRQDPLYHHRGTPRLAIELQRAAASVQRSAKKLNYPTLLIHGDGDTICNIEGSRRFYRNANSDQLAFKSYPDAYHELFNDICRDRVYQDVDHWLAQHIQAA
ncbi:lysophospholipase [gamma proteobacterium HTCC5015]|nr:lysophospholipase [gamma proteobacterium HTCC5015]